MGHNDGVRILAVLLLVACAAEPSAGDVPASTPPSTAIPSTAPSTTVPPRSADTGDLDGATVTTVVVDGRELTVALAATAEERSQGLRLVDDLGDLDGMLFTWGGETVASRFTMEGTLIPLDIVFFAADGSFVDGFTMTPCSAAPCPSYAATAPYAYALETPAGSSPAFGPGSTLVPPAG